MLGLGCRVWGLGCHLNANTYSEGQGGGQNLVSMLTTVITAVRICMAYGGLEVYLLGP